MAQSTDASASSTRKSNKRIARIIKNLQTSFENKKYYEGEQMLKTVYSRLIAQKNFDQASLLLQKGGLKLFEHQQYGAGVEIIIDLLDVWTKSECYLDNNKGKYLLTCLSLIPSSERKPVHSLMQSIIKWNAGNEERLRKSEVTINEMASNMRHLYRKYALGLFHEKDYFKGSNACVKANDVSTHIQLYAEWVQTAPVKERPYFLTRIVLQYLLLGHIPSARKFITNITPRDMTNKNWKSDARHPLDNFVDLLVESVERKSVTLYRMVCSTYGSLLNVDPTLPKYLQNVGYVCLDIPLPRGGGSLMSNLMGLLS